MAYFVTGATGFIGRHLVERLLEREGDIHVLVRAGSRDRLSALVERWGGDAAQRVKPVVGDLAEPQPRPRPTSRSPRCAARSSTSSTSPRSTT